MDGWMDAKSYLRRLSRDLWADLPLSYISNKYQLPSKTSLSFLIYHQPSTYYLHSQTLTPQLTSPHLTYT